MSGSVTVQTGELGQFANDLRMSADTVKNTASNVSNNSFGDGMHGPDAEAGRKYADQGKKIKAGLDNIGKWLAAWSDSAAAIADNIGAANIAYSTTDEESAKKTNSVTK